MASLSIQNVELGPWLGEKRGWIGRFSKSMLCVTRAISGRALAFTVVGTFRNILALTSDESFLFSINGLAKLALISLRLSRLLLPKFIDSKVGAVMMAGQFAARSLYAFSFVYIIIKGEEVPAEVFVG